jgi:hypothetical protein
LHEGPESSINSQVVQRAITRQQRGAPIELLVEDLHIGNAWMSGGQGHQLDRMAAQPPR